MAYNRRRPTGGYGVSAFMDANKETFEAAAVEAGVVVEVRKVDKGAWNERREFFANGERVGVAMKGDRPDWDAMQSAVEKMGR